MTDDRRRVVEWYTRQYGTYGVCSCPRPGAPDPVSPRRALSAVPIGLAYIVGLSRRHRDPRTPSPAARHRGPGTHTQRRDRRRGGRPGCEPLSGTHTDPVRDRARRRDRRRLFHAPRGVRPDHRGVPGHRRGQGRPVRKLVRCVRRPEPRRRGRPARGLRRLLARDRHDPPRRRGPRRPRLERRPQQGLRHRQCRELRGPARQPQGHQDVGRPDPTRCHRHHPQSVHFGRRALEYPGRLWRQAAQGRQDRGRGRSPT